MFTLVFIIRTFNLSCFRFFTGKVFDVLVSSSKYFKQVYFTKKLILVYLTVVSIPDRSRQPWSTRLLGTCNNFTKRPLRNSSKLCACLIHFLLFVDFQFILRSMSIVLQPDVSDQMPYELQLPIPFFISRSFQPPTPPSPSRYSFMQSTGL